MWTAYPEFLRHHVLPMLRIGHPEWGGDLTDYDIAVSRIHRDVDGQSNYLRHRVEREKTYPILPLSNISPKVDIFGFDIVALNYSCIRAINSAVRTIVIGKTTDMLSV